MIRVIHRRAVVSRVLGAVLFLGLAGHPLTDPGLSAAAPQLKVYFAADFKDEAYQKKTYMKVGSAWKRPTSTPKPGKKAVVIAVRRCTSRADRTPGTRRRSRRF